MLPLTLGIWGFVGYKIYQYLNEGDDDLPVISSVNIKLAEENQLDSFVIFNNYKDPFLGDNSKELCAAVTYTGTHYNNPGSITNKNKQPKTNQKNTAQVNTPIDTWPKVIYNGMMTNETKKQSIGFVTIDGSSHRVQAGDNIGELKIISFSQNEIVVAKGKEKKSFGK